MKSKDAALFIREDYPWIQHAEGLDWCRVLIYAIKDQYKEIEFAEMLSNYGAYISEYDRSEELENVGVNCFILAPIRREFVNPHSAGRNRHQISLKLNAETDVDILERLDEEDNVQGYIKSLIRQNIYLDDILDSMEINNDRETDSDEEEA